MTKEKATTERLLNVRKVLKKKSPIFIRQQTQKYYRIKRIWRKPKGIHSKLREQHKGHPEIVKIGWRSPVLVRGLHSSGLAPMRIANVDALHTVNKQTQGIIIAAAVGLKKRLRIIEEAAKLGISILNLRNAEAYVRKQKENLEKRKVQKTKKQEEKESKKTEVEKKEKKKEEKNIDDLTEEEKKKQEKEEKDKVLTKKQ